VFRVAVVSILFIISCLSLSLSSFLKSQFLCSNLILSLRAQISYWVSETRCLSVLELPVSFSVSRWGVNFAKPNPTMSNSRGCVCQQDEAWWNSPFIHSLPTTVNTIRWQRSFAAEWFFFCFHFWVKTVLTSWYRIKLGSLVHTPTCRPKNLAEAE
jgi:hypothetical protein